jgi:hypothetical protein
MDSRGVQFPGGPKFFALFCSMFFFVREHFGWLLIRPNHEYESEIRIGLTAKCKAEEIIIKAIPQSQAISLFGFLSLAN